nr:MAG TPA: CodY-like protein [Caudoviricetes sp.]
MNGYEPTTALLGEVIPFGRHNAISRAELAGRLGMTDRKMRKAVENARCEGLMILNDSDGRGYYQSDDLAEIQRQYDQDTSRAMAILKRRKPMREVLKEAGRKV